MKALIFAAGKGERMRPLTEHTPKPLLAVGGKPLIVWHLQNLAAAGIRDIIINTAWLASRLHDALGDGSAWGVRITWSHEGAEPLETGGGLLHALPLLGDAAFLVVNGDVYCDVDFSALPSAPQSLAHLLMVDPPAHSAHGDFALGDDGLLHSSGESLLTYSGIGVYHPQLFAHWQRDVAGSTGADTTPPTFRLAPLLRAAMARNQVSGEYFNGRWADIGTPERLAALDAALRGGRG
ncbi:MAG: nucleotidyltransferase family protein [Xanthomonadaceae bacterium]|nr:nucleotidyltransferase family protein [Xanthomonadaceae bacterium]MDP2186373.1 nucleotidyltransferase family protein [Xanthomonadales bacterium]MDZ4377243.1 nucleotidyltransferase family protein [Xanthomonadaceae bacterium]